MIWAAHIKLVAYHHFIKGFLVSLECLNENKCVILCAIFFISHTQVCDMRYICIPFSLILGVKVVYNVISHNVISYGIIIIVSWISNF